MLDKLLKWDSDTFVYLNGLGVEQYDGFWSTITHISTWIPLFILFIVLFYLNFPKNEALYKFLTVLGLVVFITAITHITKISVLQKSDKATAALLEYNQKLKNDSRVETVLLPIRDGLTLSRVR